jgi:hypothetical protein
VRVVIHVELIVSFHLNDNDGQVILNADSVYTTGVYFYFNNLVTYTATSLCLSPSGWSKPFVQFARMPSF